MAPARPAALSGASQQLVTGAGVYRGVALRETAGAVARVRVWDGVGATGILLDTIALAANGSASLWYDDGGLWFTAGVYVEIVAGTVEGSVRVG